MTSDPISSRRPPAPKLSDARSTRSQQALRQGLLQLMEQTPFEEITLRDIVDRAEVSYPTFYRHYAAKEDLLADLARDEITRFMALPFARSGEGPSPGERICDYIGPRRALWRTLLMGAAAPIMRAEFIRHGQEIAERGPRLNPRFPAEVMAGVTASGLFEIIAWWLRQGDDYPVSEVVQMLELLVINPITRPQAR